MFGGLWDSFIRFKAAQGVSERTLNDYGVRVKKLFLSRFPTGDAQELRDSALLFLSEPAAPAIFNEHEKASPLESLAGAPPRRRYRAR